MTETQEMKWNRISTKRVALAAGAFVVAIAIFAVIVILNSTGGESREDFSGDWEAEEGGFEFEAEIHNDEIMIHLIMDGARGLYWLGDFEVDSSVDDGDAVHSEANQEELEWSMYGSLAEDKEFRYTDGKLEFDFAIMGVERQIELEDVE